MTTATQCARYCADLGWYLVTIPAGSKAPKGMGWQRPERAISTAEDATRYWTDNPSHNVGLLHGASGTVALDIDHVENTRIALAGLGVDYDEIMAGAPRIIGRKDRGKALFRAPKDVTLSRRALTWPKTGVVFELRAGNVQDVLPPSIHPDTGNPYTWAGPSVFDGLPELPPQILTIWNEWDRFRPQLIGLCPWADEPVFQPPPKPRQHGDRASVIDGYNAAHSITDALTRYGYKQQGRSNRYLSPNSTSGLAGVVVFEDGRAYSHHASDPFDSAHTFDAFDLYTYYEHGGNVTEAVKAAGEYLGVTRDEPPAPDPEAVKHGRAIVESWKPKHGLPDAVTSVPGKLQDFVNQFATEAVMDQPQFAALAAILFGAVILGRRWRTVAGNYASFYAIAIGDTGCGKEHIRRAITKALADAGLERLIGPSGYTSQAGVMSSLLSKPTQITVIDEIGRKLKQASARDNSNAHGMLTALMEVYGLQGGVLSPQGYSKAGLTKSQSEELDRVVRHPSLTVCGMSTVADFTEAIGFGDVASGFLNRFIIIETEFGIPMPRVTRQVEMSERLKEWAQRVANASSGAGNLSEVDSAEQPPDPVVMDFTPEAMAFLDQITREIHDYRNRHKDSPLSAMKSRVRETIMRLSLIAAVSQEEDAISEGSLRWAYEFVTYYNDKAIAQMSQYLSVNDFHSICNETVRAINEAGAAGIAEWRLCRQVARLKGCKPREREEVFKALIADHGIRKVERRPDRGRPALVWVMPEHVEDDE